MIRNRNIANDAGIDVSKIQGMGEEGPIIGERHYVAKSGIEARTWLESRVPGGNLHATLDAALDAAVNSRGDKIYVCPYHTETITGAGGITLDKIGVDIKGLGRYDARPAFLMDGALCSMLVTAADMSMENCVFNSGHADLAYFALVTAKGFRFAHNFIGENTSTEDWITAIQLGAANNDADGAEIVGNEIVGIGATATGSIVVNKDMNDVKIIGNRITGQFGVTPFAPIYMPTAEVAKNIQVFHNHIHNLHNADAVVGISMDCTTATGWMMYNHCYALDVAGETPFLTGATGIYCSQNYTSYQASLSGFEYPAINTV